MKRFIIALSIIVMLATIPTYLSVLAQPIRAPHEDPVTAEGSPELVSLLLFYGNVFDLAALRQYQDAQAMLKELQYANIPDELRYLIDRYSTLSQQLFAAMNNLEFLLDKVSTLFSDNQISEAKQELAAAEVAINDTLLLLEDIEAATNAIGDKLGVFAALVGSDITLAYERLEGILQRLRQLTNELNQLRESLSDNPQMVINTRFYLTTLLEVSAPETAYPGLPFTVSGQVSPSDGTVDRVVKVLLDNIQLSEETVRGQFSLQVTPPQQVSTGKHNLVVVATPQGRYSGASKSLAINISRFPIQMDIHLPRLTLFPKSIQISGKVYHGLGPLEDAQVSIIFRQSSAVVRTSTDGSFSSTIEAPLDLSLSGVQELTIAVEPVEAWYASLEAKRWILTINPANMSLMLVVFISLGLLVYTRVRTKPSRLRQETVTPQTIVPEPTTITPSPRPKYEFTGTKGRILSAYTNALEVVEKVTGVSMQPHTTLRELLKASVPRLPGAINSFTELTTMAEIVLYSTHDLDPNSAARAEQIATTIKEELDSGAS